MEMSTNLQSMNLEKEAVLALMTTIAEMGANIQLLLENLQSERLAIINADHVALYHIDEVKVDLVQKLEKLDADRINAAKLAPNANVAAWDSWKTFCEKLKEVNKLNQRNGVLVQQRLHVVRQALALLTGNDPVPPVYGKGGDVTPRLRGKNSIVV
jgi:flagellar biosynthesis protein FlgN